MIDLRFVTTHDNFIGRNYPLAFVKNCEVLEKRGKLKFMMISSTKIFILLKVI